MAARGKAAEEVRDSRGVQADLGRHVVAPIVAGEDDGRRAVGCGRDIGGRRATELACRGQNSSRDRTLDVVIGIADLDRVFALWHWKKVRIEVRKRFHRRARSS